MDKSTVPTDWRTVLREQGRTLRWLALRTDKSPRTVYAYSRGELIPTDAWMTKVCQVLDAEVTK